MKLKLSLTTLAIFLALGNMPNAMAGNQTKSIDNPNEVKTSKLYNQWIKDPSPNIAELNLFFTLMPKGGDLHNHYSGSLYVETYLDWVKDNNYWINTKTFKIDTTQGVDDISVDILRQDDTLYRELLTHWSDKDYRNHFDIQVPPDKNFFDTFGYFSTVSGLAYQMGLTILKDRAIKENVSYIETMLTSPSYSYTGTGKNKSVNTDFDTHVRTLENKLDTNENWSKTEQKTLFHYFDHLKSKIDSSDKTNFNTAVDNLIKMVNDAHKGIDDKNFMMRFQTYISRTGNPSKVFAGLYAAFEAANKSDLIVGVNIVGPENNVVAIEDYTLHMEMFNYLKQKFPNVHRALHAGELAQGMVRPKNMTFHIDQALDIAKAQRIGHGVDLPYEQNSVTILDEMKRDHIPVEICLTSNQFILGVKGREHPYLIYSAYHVPMVISTDDSGVSRDNLTHEYVMLSSQYKPSYEQIKQYVYNSIRYSFLNEKTKKTLTTNLNKRFISFEKEMAHYANGIEDIQPQYKALKITKKAIVADEQDVGEQQVYTKISWDTYH